MMVQFQLILPVLFTLAFGETEMIDISCTTRQGTAATTVGSISIVSCLSTETLVSCGIKGTHNIGGARVNPNDKNSCQVLSHYDSTAYPAYSEAVCCTFPDSAINSVTDIISTAGTLVSSTCPSDTVLTGCHVYYAGGGVNQIKGSFTGSQSGPPQTISWISTDNKCTAQTKTSSTTVTAEARCIAFSSGYTLTCETKAKYTNYANFGQCEAGYNMFGCNTYTTSAYTLDGYYVNANGACYVQQDGHKSQYANAICCQLTKEKEVAMCCANTGGQKPKQEAKMNTKCKKAQTEKACLRKTDKSGNNPCIYTACNGVIVDDGEYWVSADNVNNMLYEFHPIINGINGINAIKNDNIWIFVIGIILLGFIVFALCMKHRYKCSENKVSDHNKDSYGSISCNNSV